MLRYGPSSCWRTPLQRDIMYGPPPPPPPAPPQGAGASAELFAPGLGWRTVPDMLSAREACCACLLPDQRLVAAGARPPRRAALPLDDPLHTGFANISGAALSEAAMRPTPRWWLAGRRRTAAATSPAWRPTCRASATGARCLSARDAELAQKLDQLQPFVAVIPQECTGQLAFFGPT
jgi:hypothetical protein